MTNWQTHLSIYDSENKWTNGWRLFRLKNLVYVFLNKQRKDSKLKKDSVSLRYQDRVRTKLAELSLKMTISTEYELKLLVSQKVICRYSVVTKTHTVITNLLLAYST